MMISPPAPHATLTMLELRAIRDANSLKHADMSAEEIIADLNAGAAHALNMLAQLSHNTKEVTP